MLNIKHQFFVVNMVWLFPSLPCFCVVCVHFHRRSMCVFCDLTNNKWRALANKNKFPKEGEMLKLFRNRRNMMAKSTPESKLGDFRFIRNFATEKLHKSKNKLRDWLGIKDGRFFCESKIFIREMWKKIVEKRKKKLKF